MDLPDCDSAINPLSLKRELMCPICLDILNQTMTTRDCLHRFCSACINKSLRTGNKECPTCRKKLTSRRCLRADPNFDQLIEKIYNGDHQETSKVFIIPECEVILRPLKGEAKARYIKCPPTTTMNHLSKYLSMRPEGLKEVESNSDDVYQICIVENRVRGTYEVFKGHETMNDIKKTHQPDNNRPLELYYRLGLDK